jgi:excisionase family DNA binding protein
LVVTDRLLSRHTQRDDRQGDIISETASSEPEKEHLHLVETTEAVPESETKPEKLVTAAEVAELLSVHQNYVYELAGHGELPSYKFGGNRRFRWSEVESWLRRTYVQPSSEATTTEGG